MIKGVCFDLFHTLVTAPRPTGPSEADRLGVDEDIYGRVRADWHARRMISRIDYRDVLTDVYRNAGFKITEPRKLIIDRLADERALWMANVIVDVEDGILELLRWIGAMGVRITVISNCAVEEIAAWDSSPLSTMIDEVVSSCQVGVAKPDSEIYRLACDRLGVRPAEAVFVGDGGSDELRGAERAGLRPYVARWFTNRWDLPEREQVLARTAAFQGLDQPEDLITVLAQE